MSLANTNMQASDLFRLGQKLRRTRGGGSCGGLDFDFDQDVAIIITASFHHEYALGQARIETRDDIISISVLIVTVFPLSEKFV